ncbi:methyltransferase domain-containing protein [uncultured Shewanella sp.]|uniref:methyltransferase domain-containing protein n=1 Tax=uncultured Shewanella sp. TaxID=173975 RepID=UPI0026063E11|nr:methyltransferase domain-containing protein [uncultured Shewanella sp.]
MNMTMIQDPPTRAGYRPVKVKSNSQISTVRKEKFDWSQLIANDFSAAATGYHEHNIVQKHTSSMLCHQLSAQGILLDIGAGPGTDFSLFPKVNSVISLDIAGGMLNKLTENFPEYKAIQGDAESLPLLSNSVNAIYSNLALQWCRDIRQAILEAARVLMPSGSCEISVVAENSLPELTSLGFKVNRFQSFETLVSCFDKQHWQLIEARLEPVTVYFDDLKALLYSIKGVGASATTNEQMQPSLRLRGRQDWLSLNEKANRLKQSKGIPLTYNVVVIRAKRKLSRV